MWPYTCFTSAWLHQDVTYHVTRVSTYVYTIIVIFVIPSITEMSLSFLKGLALLIKQPVNPVFLICVLIVIRLSSHYRYSIASLLLRHKYLSSVYFSSFPAVSLQNTYNISHTIIYVVHIQKYKWDWSEVTTLIIRVFLVLKQTSLGRWREYQ